MKKYEVDKLPEELVCLADTLKTTFDNLFDKSTILKGKNYYSRNCVLELNKNNNIYNASVQGKKIYNVEIEMLDDKLSNVYCSCPNHKTNTYCKHIYAVLYNIKLNGLSLIVYNLIKENIDTIKSVITDIEEMYSTNESIILEEDKKLVSEKVKYYKENKINIDFENKNYFKLREILFDLEYDTKEIIDYYNRFNDYINEIKNAPDDEEYDEDDVVSYEFDLFDNDLLIDKLDAYIASLPLELLERVRIENIKDNIDNTIIDKAIRNKKKQIKLLEQQEKEIRRLERLKTLSNINELLSIFTSKSKKATSKDWMRLFENEEIKKSNYEPYQFEEEELEEDDYHYDDLD